MLANCFLRRAYTTFKSRNDEQANKVLLERLKTISLSGGKETVPLTKNPNESTDRESLRNLDLEKVEKIGRYYVSDAILWNPSVLGRIYNVPEEYVIYLARYVRPVIYYAHNKLEKVEKIHKTSVVIDVNRLKHDKSYLVEYQNLVFLDHDEHPELIQQKQKIKVDQ